MGRENGCNLGIPGGGPLVLARLVITQQTTVTTAAKKGQSNRVCRSVRAEGPCVYSLSNANLQQCGRRWGKSRRLAAETADKFQQWTGC